MDAAISSLLCVGVVNLHSTGIGGGGFMLYYEAASEETYALDYREVAPLAATHNMYEGLEPTASTLGECSYRRTLFFAHFKQARGSFLGCETSDQPA